MNKTWQRKTIDSSNYNQPNADEQYSRSIPRDDVNAPDLYIPVMALVTYVLLVGFISGTKGVFTPEVIFRECPYPRCVLVVFGPLS
mmetsp:Transcript_27577/g.108096  ORF Transcript_27577/g.108096 Transcript_27577/m.108096 type:complete len:86 (+) Transcript_27577:1083-1340(+)